MVDNISDSIQINLNSKFGNTLINNSKTDVLFNIPPIQISSRQHLHVSVINAVIPHSFYNVNTSNNILIYIVNGVSYTLNIPVGNYNVIQLSTYLTSNMSSFTITYNSLLNKYTLTNSVMDFIISSMSTCNKLLGLIHINYVSTNKTMISANCIDLQPTQSIHVQSSFSTRNINSHSYLHQNTLCTIPVNCPPNSMIVYKANRIMSSNLYVSLLNQIRIALVDDNGNLLDLNGLDWNITLEFDIIDVIR